MGKVENIKKEETIMLIAGILMVVLLLGLFITASVVWHNDANKTEAIVDGALEDMSLNRSDFNIIELKIFDGTNIFVLRLDEMILLGSFDEKEDGIYVDVVKEI